MNLSSLSSVVINFRKKGTGTGTETEIEINPINVDFLLNIGPFTSVTTGTAGTYKSSVSKTITGKSILNGLYTIRSNYWPLAPNLCDAFDNNTNTYSSSVWATFNNVIDYDGNQMSYLGKSYDETTGLYLFGSTFFTSSDTGDYVGDYIDVYYPMPVIMQKYRFMTRTGLDWQTRFARQLYFFGSNDDGITWIYLHSHLKTSNKSGNYQEIIFPTMTNSYTVYRMVINSVNSAGSGFHHFSELNMIFNVA